ncbi:MAG TPA: helix-turn-helix domain-containing protein [Patescibacteria group bacterium]|nr:helix-turn-helix domain-containing protein [Patescibacteria group bacterium]
MDTLDILKQALGELGLSNNEIQCYLTSYRIGKSSIGEIARQLRMDRSSAYLAFERLKDEGLIEEDVTHSVKKVWAYPPQEIAFRLRSKIRILRKRFDDIESTLPLLLAEYSEYEAKPVLRFFSGKHGLKQITDDVLEHARGEVLLLSNQREERRVFSHLEHRNFIRERMLKNISIRVLVPDTPESHELQKEDVKCFRQTRIIHGQMHPFSSEVYMYGDRVAMVSFKNDIIGFIVHSSDFATTQRWMFEELWNTYV